MYKTCREIVYLKCIINNLQKTAKSQQRNISKYFDIICTKIETESLKSYNFTKFEMPRKNLEADGIKHN